MRIPNPIATTTTEAYLAYKAGVLAQADLKEKLYHPYIHIDGWLAYWTGLTDTYPTDKNGDPECLTDEEAYIAYLAGVTSEYPEALKDPADPRMAGYLKYLVSARFGRPNYPVTREELYLSMMKPPVVPSGDPSSSIDLEGTVEAPFISMEVYGDTYQKTYTGKNFINSHIPPVTSSVRTTLAEVDNGIEVVRKNTSQTGAAYAIVPIQNIDRLLGQVVSYSFNVDGDRADEVMTLYGYKNGTASTTRKMAFKNTSGSFTMPASLPTNEDGYCLCFYVVTGENKKATFTNIQLELGSAPTEYEKYVGGVPSPNPDYPQAVQTVTGRQVVAVTGGDGESAEYEIDLGDIELCKIGNYQDYIYRDGEDWYLHKETAKKVFSADEVWAENTTPSGKRFRNTLEGCVVATSVSEVVPLFCSAFVQGSVKNTYLGVQCISFDVIADRVWVYAEDAKDYSTTEFAEYMAGVSVYYPMATPTDTEITNTALLDQLDALVEGGSYEGETHIRISATDPNLPALLKVEAAK